MVPWYNIPMKMPESFRDADSMIAQEMNKMSLKEREMAFFDVHGVSGERSVEEDMEMVSRSLLELDTIISQTRRKDAYDMAESKNKDFVSDREFRLRFLRATEFNVSWAAEKLIKFFEMKLDVFGPDKLTKDITREDLDDDDIACLESGICQILPLRDRAGRAIVCWMSRLRAGTSVQSRVRVSHQGSYAYTLSNIYSRWFLLLPSFALFTMYSIA